MLAQKQALIQLIVAFFQKIVIQIQSREIPLRLEVQ